MKYKGYTIVTQYVGYQIWGITPDGQPMELVTEYDNEFDGYMVWNTKYNCQHEDFDPCFDTLEEVKTAINEFIKAKV